MKYYLIDGNPAEIVRRVRKNSDGTSLVQNMTLAFVPYPESTPQYTAVGKQYLIQSGRLHLPSWREPNPPRFKFHPDFWRHNDTNARPAVTPK